MTTLNRKLEIVHRPDKASPTKEEIIEICEELEYLPKEFDWAGIVVVQRILMEFLLTKNCDIPQREEILTNKAFSNLVRRYNESFRIADLNKNFP